MIINEDSDCAINNSEQFQMIRAWLYKIEEPEEDHSLVLNKCRSDSEALQYFLKHTRENMRQ